MNKRVFLAAALPDRFPDMAGKRLDQRFAKCPWAVYPIGVQA